MSLIKTLLLAELQSHQVSEPNKAAANNLAAPSFTLSHKTRKILALSLPAWYLSWSLAPFLPEALKPDIDVVSLMEWDHSMFGLLPHQALHEWFQFDPFGFPLVDFLMALPYSLHVFWPILFVLGCARAKRWNTALAFVNCFGIASFGAVFTELYYPTAPPWYYEENGTAPADYSMQGNPGTLDRVDEYFDGKFYHNTFSKSPLVFGAFPSLHVGWPTLLMLFLVHSDICCSSRIKTLIYSYFAWVCFAVVYLQHHYVIDVLGGAAYALIAFHLFGPHRDAVEPPRAATKRT